MIEQAITFDNNTITVLGQFFVHKDYSITRKDILLDVLAKNYVGQDVVIRLLDGENTNFSGFESFIKYLCDKVGIPYNKIRFESHSPQVDSDFNLTVLKLGIFISVNQYLPAEINRDLSQAKFVGTTLGRYNLNRLCLAYELDQAFAGDTFITFQPNVQFINETLKHFSLQYASELDWIRTKTFDVDLKSKHPMGMIDWYDACRNYGNVWNQFQIEVISETDSIDNFWFTEKTANCLATGKPFILISGQGSLQRLRDMGFVTFAAVLDETYDQASTPRDRLCQAIQSLAQIYNDPNRAEKIKKLYEIAQNNVIIYKHYIKI
jgi:hypothetical protein